MHTCCQSNYVRRLMSDTDSQRQTDRHAVKRLGCVRLTLLKAAALTMKMFLRRLGHADTGNFRADRIVSASQSMIDRVTNHLENLEKSGNSKVVREKSGEVKSGVFSQALNTPKLVFRLRCSPRLPSRLGRGHPIPFPSCYNPNC